LTTPRSQAYSLTMGLTAAAAVEDGQIRLGDEGAIRVEAAGERLDAFKMRVRRFQVFVARGAPLPCVFYDAEHIAARWPTIGGAASLTAQELARCGALNSPREEEQPSAPRLERLMVECFSAWFLEETPAARAVAFVKVVDATGFTHPTATPAALAIIFDAWGDWFHQTAAALRSLGGSTHGAAAPPRCNLCMAETPGGLVCGVCGREV